MLETSENIPFSTKTPLTLLMSAFFTNNSILAETVPLLKAIVWELCLRFLSSVFSFCKIKGYYLWKCKFYRPCIWNSASRCSNLAINWKNDNGIKFSDMTSSSFFLFKVAVAVFFLSSLMTDLSFMLISLLVLELWQFPCIKDWPEI